MTEPLCAAVVLAAGASSRLGQPKQLLRIGQETLVRRAVRLAQEVNFAPVYVVLGARADEIRPELAATEAVLIENTAWREGIGASLRCGVQAAEADSRPDHLLLLLCDQPSLTAPLLTRMRERHLAESPPLTAARYAGRLGAPAIFARSLFPELLAARGDRGARDILTRHTADAVTVPFLRGDEDIDTPEDLRLLVRSSE